MATILYVNATAVHGGAEEALLHVMTAATELGHVPVLVTPRPGWLTERAESLGVLCETAASLPDTMATDTWAAQFKPWLPTAFAIAGLARRHRAAIVHSNSPRTAYHGGLAARIAGARAVTHCWEILGIPWQSKPKARLLNALTDWTLVVSNAVRDAILAAAPEMAGRLTTLYLAHDPSLEAGVLPADLERLFNIPPNALVIGNAAAMTPWKGQDVLVEAFHRVHEEIPNARLVLLGGSQGSSRQDSFEKKLFALVKDRRLEDKVTFTGWREDWLSIVASYDVFVHATTGPDPLPIVLIRASALGRAIIATQLGGIPEILGPDGGWLVPAGDAAALGEALKQLAENPARRAELGMKARERIGNNFSWDQLKTTLAGVYDRLLRRHPDAAG